jgi:hypothetical protein
MNDGQNYSGSDVKQAVMNYQMFVVSVVIIKIIDENILLLYLK